MTRSAFHVAIVLLVLTVAVAVGGATAAVPYDDPDEDRPATVGSDRLHRAAEPAPIPDDRANGTDDAGATSATDDSTDGAVIQFEGKTFERTEDQHDGDRLTAVSEDVIVILVDEDDEEVLVTTLDPDASADDAAGSDTVFFEGKEIELDADGSALRQVVPEDAVFLTIGNRTVVTNADVRSTDDVAVTAADGDGPDEDLIEAAKRVG